MRETSVAIPEPRLKRIGPRSILQIVIETPRILWRAAKVGVTPWSAMEWVAYGMARWQRGEMWGGLDWWRDIDRAEAERIKQIEITHHTRTPIGACLCAACARARDHSEFFERASKALTAAEEHAQREEHRAEVRSLAHGATETERKTRALREAIGLATERERKAKRPRWRKVDDDIPPF